MQLRGTKIHLMRVLLVVNGQGLFGRGEGAAAFGFGLSALFSVLGAKARKPTPREFYRVGSMEGLRAARLEAGWKFAHFLRFPMLLLGIAGLVMMLVAALA